MIENGCKKITSPTNVLSFGQFEYIFQNYYQYHKDCGAAWVATLVLRVWQNCCWLVSAFQKVWFWNFSMGSAGELICCAKLDPTQSNASPIKSDRRKKWRRKKCSHFWPNFCHFCTKKLFSSGLNKNISKPHFLECTNQPRTKNKFWALTILSNLCTSSTWVKTNVWPLPRQRWHPGQQDHDNCRHHLPAAGNENQWCLYAHLLQHMLLKRSGMKTGESDDKHLVHDRQHVTTIQIELKSESLRYISNFLCILN